MATRSTGHLSRISPKYNRLYEYSFLNQMLLGMQGVNGAPIATYARWRSLGRQVMKGTKAREIIRPICVRRKEVAEGEDATYRRFKMVKCIFPLSDTEGDELPPASDPPEWKLERALLAMGIERVPFEELDGNIQGYSLDRKLAINPVAAYPLKTTFHQIGHIMLGHTTADGRAEYVRHRGVHEF
jgi:hypothetical protein